MEYNEKQIYVQGMIEGLKFRGEIPGPWQAATRDLRVYIENLDHYYSNSENILIPVVLMLDVVNSDISNSWESKEEKEFRLEFLREHSESK